MTDAVKTFRVFVSSTFSDLKEERTALQRDAFPRLRTLCDELGARFQDIDLRWGVSEEAGLDQQTLDICLDEVRRSQEASPKPNFIVLLGDRYGWRPLPAHIPAADFAQILNEVADVDRGLLVWEHEQDPTPVDRVGWYRHDANAVTPEYYLRPREIAVADDAPDEDRRIALDAEAETWREIEPNLWRILAGAMDGLGWSEFSETDQPSGALPESVRRRRRYDASATEHEIVRGVLDLPEGVPDVAEHVFGFFRAVDGLAAREGLPVGVTVTDFVDLDANAHRDADAARRLAELKQMLGTLLPGHIHDYSASWTGSAVTTCAVSDDGSEVVSAGDDLTLRIWKVATGDEVARLSLDRPAVACALTDEGVVVHKRDADHLEVLDRATGESLRTLDLADFPGSSVISAEGSVKVRGDADGSLRLFDPAGNRELAPLGGHTSTTTDHLRQLCDDVYASLAAVITAEVDRERAERVATGQDELELETARHEQFAVRRVEHLEGRDDELRAIREHRDLRGGTTDRPRLFVVQGEAGSGKTSLMAKAFEEARSDAGSAGAVVMARFIGTTPDSSDGRALLSSLCQQLSRRYAALSRSAPLPDEHQHLLDEAAVPSEYNKLVTAFRDRLLHLPDEHAPLWLFLDAVDQLSDADDARNLVWLPSALPEYARVVVSTLPGQCATELEQKHPPPAIEPLAGLSGTAAVKVLEAWLLAAHPPRELQPSQTDHVIDAFLASSSDEDKGLPLYLRLASEETRRWKSHHDPARHPLPHTTTELADRLFDRLARPANHGHALVAASLANLAASRFGLSEDELLGVLSADGDVMAAFRTRSPRSPRAARLPFVVWSRVAFELLPYFTERSAEGEVVLDFYHRQLRADAHRRYVDGVEHERHAALATYFRTRSDPTDKKEWDGSARGLSELPFHLTKAGDEDGLFEVLTDFTFLERKVGDVGVVRDAAGKPITYTGVYALGEDYARALDERFGGPGPDGDRRRRIIVTAWRDESEDEKEPPLSVRCPFCQHESPITDTDLGRDDLNCANEECAGPLRINPFTVRRPQSLPSSR